MTTELGADAAKPEATDLLEMAATVVAAYVSNNAVTGGELPALIADVHASLAKVAQGVPAVEVASPLVPAVPIRKSVGNDFIVCLEDGKKFKSLKRHLGTKFGMTPVQYRAKWGLPRDYPMVAPEYAAQRSALAKAVGLGAARAATAKGRSGKKPKAA